MHLDHVKSKKPARSSGSIIVPPVILPRPFVSRSPARPSGWNGRGSIVSSGEGGTVGPRTVDGGAPGTTIFNNTFDGGSPSTTTFSLTIDGGTLS